MTKKKVTPKEAQVLGRLTEYFEEATADASSRKYELRLYVAGQNLSSKRAILAITKICEEYVAGRYDLEVIDIYQNPEVAKAAQLIAAPTLIKSQPAPLRRLVGDLSDTNRVLLALNLVPEDEDKAAENAEPKDT